jgi:GNAT superfamily N-acetyltransferase
MDVVRIAEIIQGEPSPEAVGLVGDRRLASAFGEGLVELDHVPNAAKSTVVAEIDGGVVGVLQCTIGEGMNVTLAHLRLALRLAGLARLVIASAPRPPTGGLASAERRLYVAELQVDPALRGQGIGGRLLDWADDEARGSATGASLSHLRHEQGTTSVRTSRVSGDQEPRRCHLREVHGHARPDPHGERTRVIKPATCRSAAP